MREKQLVILAALVATLWAVPLMGTAHSYAKSDRQVQKDQTPPMPARFRVERERGLLLTVWINDRGPYVFAIDTGAGMNLITQDAAARSGLTIRGTHPVSL